MKPIAILGTFMLFLLFSAGCTARSTAPPKQAAPPINSGKAETPVQTPSPDPSPSSRPASPSAQTPSPATPSHVVVVVEENHSYKQIVGNKQAPYIQSLINNGALFTNAHGITHPSQPNYLALFSGSVQNVKDDACHDRFTADNLASELIKAKYSFIGYSEDLPKTGFTGCSSGGYARKHNPWAQFTNVPPEANRPLSDFPADFEKLPAVSFVIPSVKNDMHDGTVKEADDWLSKHLGEYVNWAGSHNSLLIVTWDEDDFSKDNHIPVIFAGPMIKQGTYNDNINHYHVLRTIEDLYHLGRLGKTADAEPLSMIWK